MVKNLAPEELLGKFLVKPRLSRAEVHQGSL